MKGIKAKVVLAIVGLIALLGVAIVLGMQFGKQNFPAGRTIPRDWKAYENPQIGIQFRFPNEWEIGQQDISNVYWVGLPNYASEGNVTLRVIPWLQNPHLETIQSKNYELQLLGNGLYKEVEIKDFDNGLKIGATEALFVYYKGVGGGVLDGRIYNDVIIQWWRNNLLYTMYGNFSDPELTYSQIDQFRTIAESIRLISQ